VRSHELLKAAARVAEPKPSPPPIVEDHAAGEPAAGTGPVEQAPQTIAFDVASELNELFFAADAHERRLILLNLEVAVPVSGGWTEVVPDAAIGQRLETAALARNREDFSRHLAHVLHIPRAQARRVVSDDLGEPIVTAAKVLNISRDVLYRILLFVNANVGHSVERVHALAVLYDEIPVQAAQHMVAIWQALQTDERAASAHRPLLWNDEARAPARTATATVRRAPSGQRPNQRRDAS
jgi:hypothetical protein